MTNPDFVGDLAFLYRTPNGLRKVAQTNEVRDLLWDEGVALRHLHTAPRDPQFLPYVPNLVDMNDGENLITEAPDGFVTLREVMDRVPDGLDPRDMAWIFRRLLTALGFVHRNGYVHMAVVPEHVLVHPIDHGLILIDWCYAVEFGGPPKVLVPDYRSWYPQQVFDGDPARPNIDVAMTCKLMAEITCELPPRMRAFMAGATRIANSHSWSLKADFDDLLESMYGKRKYRPLVLP